MPVPVHILGGFLGTGKTSAIRAQLAARPGERVAVIVNDFGEAGLDASTLEGSAPYQITAIPGGCVCCTAPEGFVAALGALLEEKPDRVWIEPTGLARPQDLVDTIRRSPHKDALEIAPVVVLVDPARIARASSEGERALVAQQTGIADVLVANRVDLCDDEALDAFEALARGLWPGPMAVHRTTFGRLPPAALEWPEGEGARLPRAAAGVARQHEHGDVARQHEHGDVARQHEHGDVATEQAHDHGEHAHSTAGFAARSFRWSPDLVFSRERVERAALRASQGLAGAPLARFKGIFRTQEGFLRVEVAGGALHVERSLHRRDSRADAIFEIAEDAPEAEAAGERLAGWLAGAVLTEKESQTAADQIELAFPDGRVRIVRRESLTALPGGVDDVAALIPKRSGAAARVSALFDSLAVPTTGRAVLCAADGFASEPVPLPALREGLLVHTLEGAPLPATKGGPFRLLIPEGVPDAPSACANVKGVVRIVLQGPE